jgi:hypothetical protein
MNQHLEESITSGSALALPDGKEGDTRVYVDCIFLDHSAGDVVTASTLNDSSGTTMSMMM